MSRLSRTAKSLRINQLHTSLQEVEHQFELHCQENSENGTLIHVFSDEHPEDVQAARFSSDILPTLSR